MKKYTFQVVIEEGSDEFWDEINNKGITGCDQVLELVEDALDANGLFNGKNDSNIKLVAFSDGE